MSQRKASNIKAFLYFMIKMTKNIKVNYKIKKIHKKDIYMCV